MSLAPIILFVYNRPWHTEQTLESLMTNELSNETVLYIYADGLKIEDNEENVKSIAATRAVLRKKQWCKNIHIIERKYNFGLAENIISGVTEVLIKHEKVIVLEDDLVCAKGFLKYMNEALDLYEIEESVCSVHAYNYPIETKNLTDTFFLKGADCWGWGVWRRSWGIFERDGSKLLAAIESKGLTKAFNFDNSYDFSGMLKSQIEGKVDSWAIRWYASAFLSNKFTLYPKISLVRNIGLDGSGTHCSSDSILSTNFQNYCNVKPIPISENKKAKKRINLFLKPNLFQKNKKKVFLWVSKMF